MTRRLVLFFAVAGICGVLGITGAACKGGGGDKGGTSTPGGGNAQTLEDYLTQVGIISQQFNDATSSLGNQLQETQDLGAAKDLIAQYPEVMGTFLDSFGQLTPPDDVQSLHSDVLEKGRAMQTALSDASGRAQDANTMDDLQTVFDTPDLSTAGNAFNATCAPLQDYADSHSIEVDLHCPQ